MAVRLIFWDAFAPPRFFQVGYGLHIASHDGKYWSPEGHPLSPFPSRIAYRSSTLIGRPSWQQITSTLYDAVNPI